MSQKLEILDGYRGFLAITVILQHFGQFFPNSRDFKFFQGPGSFVGVSGFFVLSAFLLTYRLMIDFERSQNSYKQMILRVIQYSIRRFFRIYIVYVVFLKLTSWIYTRDIIYSYTKVNGISADALLLRTTIGHMWTIPLEIRYYFCVPFISFAFYKTGRLWFLFWIGSVVLVLLNQKYNPFHFNVNDFKYNRAYMLPVRFTMFFSGSLLAVFYVNMRSMVKFQEICKNTYIQKLLSLLVYALFAYQTYKWPGSIGKVPKLYLYSFTSAVNQCCLIALVIYCTERTNMIVDMFNSTFFRLCGQYSFGLYLLHPSLILYFTKHPLRYLYHSFFVIVSTTFIVSMFWFYVLEDPLMRIANFICKKIEKIKYFKAYEPLSPD